MKLILYIFQFPFIQRALITGILVSLCAALLGVILVLRRYSMIGDGLSHVSFGALSLAMALGITPLYVSIPIVVVSAILLLRVKEKSINTDAAIAVVSSASLAFGVTVTALTTGINADMSSYMFGSILVMTTEDVILSVIMSVLVLILYVFSYQKIFAVTFDENFAKASGVNTSFYDMLISVFTAIIIVLGMRMMGAMLISSLIIFPALIAMKLKKSFFGVVVCAGAVSVITFLIGLTVSFLISTPTGASIVLVNVLVYAGVCIAARVQLGR